MANQKLLSQFREVLKRNGLKFTRQRVEVLEEIIKDKGHRDCEDILIIIDIFKDLGCKLVIMTNSSGCVIKEWDVGDLMLVTGHIDYSFRNSNEDPKIIQDSRYNQNLIDKYNRQ